MKRARQAAARAASILALMGCAGGSLALLSLQDDGAKRALIPPSTMEPPLAETRLPVHTLLREDVFGGFLMNDMKRFDRGEKNADLLMQQRPDQKGNLLAWKAGIALYRAVLAHEAGRNEEFDKLYSRSSELFADAKKEIRGNEGVNAIRGGSFVIFTDRLPKEKQKEGWQIAYESYQSLWKQQSSVIKGFPPHLCGEVMAGMAQSAQRTGHADECQKFLKLLVETLPNSPYAPIAKQWLSDPAKAASTQIACVSCHEPGRLTDRLRGLDKK